jgi:hypothetical protein
MMGSCRCLTIQRSSVDLEDTTKGEHGVISNSDHWLAPARGIGYGWIPPPGM